jgi:ADP-ribose pyrophosphatase
LEVISDEEIGSGGFLTLRRLHLRNLHPDGTRSAEWVCDFAERPRGLDGVVVALWRRRPNGALEVLVRDGLRPALDFGRPASRQPLPDRVRHFLFTELVAGVIEEGERGEEAVRRRAADEAWEEAGYRIAPSEIEFLGGPIVPASGISSEKVWLTAARAPDGDPAPPEGDGTPMEEGAFVRWMLVEDALAACDRGEIEDAKLELTVRRLIAKLAR